MSEYQHIVHAFEPVYNEKSRILILGSFPSVKSREQGFYYGHPQNRFWKVIASVTASALPVTIDEKKDILLANNIAVWDVVYSCDIVGSSDSSIRNVIPADIGRILDNSPIERIYANGQTAGKLYNKWIYPQNKREITILPSTSPANAMMTLDKLIYTWKIEVLRVL